MGSEDECEVRRRSESSDESLEDAHDEWQLAVNYAMKQVKLVSLTEPHLSEFIGHVRDYVEARFQFVKAMELDETYENLDKMIKSLVREGYDREEAVEKAWHERRFLLKRKLREYILKAKRDADDDDENDEASDEEETEEEETDDEEKAPPAPASTYPYVPGIWTNPRY